WLPRQCRGAGGCAGRDSLSAGWAVRPSTPPGDGMRHMVPALAAALPIGCSSGVADAQEAAGTHRLAGERVAVYNLAGRVMVESGSGADVTVTVTPGGADGADGARLQALS